MRALMLVEHGVPMQIEDVDPIDPGPNDVVLDISACGICRSDYSLFKGIVSTPQQLPMVLGHEVCGRISWVGVGVSRFRVGQRVIASATSGVFECPACERGQPNLCQYIRVAKGTPKYKRSNGNTATALVGIGGFAQQATCHAASLVAIDSDLPDDQLCLIGCGVQTGVGAVFNMARVAPGASVAVVGCGGIGLSVIQAARIAGASTIYAIDNVKEKRDAALSLGATHAIDPAQGDVVEGVRTLSSGGVDYSFEVVGLPDLVRQAYGMARRGGRVIIIGHPAAGVEVSFDGHDLFYEQKLVSSSLFGGGSVRYDFPRIVRLAESGQFDLCSLISRRIKLEEVNAAMAAIDGGSVIRNVVLP